MKLEAPELYETGSMTEIVQFLKTRLTDPHEQALLEDNPFGPNDFGQMTERLNQMSSQHGAQTESKFDPHQNHFQKFGTQQGVNKQNGNLYTGDSDDGASDDMSANR